MAAQVREQARQGPAELKPAVALRLRTLEASAVIALTDFDAISMRCGRQCHIRGSQCRVTDSVSIYMTRHVVDTRLFVSCSMTDSNDEVGSHPHGGGFAFAGTLI